jgi:hypothetical protein
MKYLVFAPYYYLSKDDAKPAIDTARTIQTITECTSIRREIAVTFFILCQFRHSQQDKCRP